MRICARAMVVVGILAAGMATAAAQGTKIPAQAAPFLGTWTVTMTAPDAMKGTQVTVRIWDRNGSVAASIQTRQEGVANEATGVLLDGDMLIFTIGHHGKPPMLENGAPIWATFTLTLDGDSLQLAQTLERSVTIKRGVGRKQ